MCARTRGRSARPWRTSDTTSCPPAYGYRASAAMAAMSPIDLGGGDEVVRGDAQRIVAVAEVVVNRAGTR